MLMQNFKSADELGITEPQFDALRKTLVLLETGKLVHEFKYSHLSGEGGYTGHFNMGVWRGEAECGTVCCIGGTAELLGGVGLGGNTRLVNPPLHALFMPSVKNWRDITPAQAATALRSYLTTGSANWGEAVR